MELFKKVFKVFGGFLSGVGAIIFFGSIIVGFFTGKKAIICFITTPIGAVIGVLGGLIFWASGGFKNRKSS